MSHPTDMRDGVINVNKPAGWTSQDVCAKLRHALHIKKIGHTGTLDPMATGVLPVCLGNATRIIEYYDRDRKSYHACMKLGITTDTLDITGTVLTETPVEVVPVSDEVMRHRNRPHVSLVSEADILKAFENYKGMVEQIPPKYSALKINGKRAYDLAREGKDFEIKPRQITIYENKVTRIDPAACEVEFDVTCSKGTYIRTICDDIGRALGCGAVMTALTRTATGCFRIEDSHTIEEIIEAAEETTDAQATGLDNMLIPADVTLEKLGCITLNDNRITAFLNGNSSWPNGFHVTEPSDFDNIYRVYANEDSGLRFVGIGSIENGSLMPVKVFRP